MSDSALRGTLPKTSLSEGSDADSLLRATFESGLLLLVLKFMEPVLFGAGSYAQMDFHPYWIVILLAAMHYGLFGGVAAAGLASLLMEWPPRPLGVDIAEHYTEMAMQPLNWLIVALCVGSYRSLQIHEMRRVKKRLASVLEVNESLAAEVHRVDAALAQAELAFVTEQDDVVERTPVFGSLLELLHSSASAEDLGAAFASAAASATPLPAGLLLPDRSGRIAELTGGQGISDLSRTIASNESLLRRAVEAPRSLVIRRSEVGLGDRGYLAVARVHATEASQKGGAVFIVADTEDEAQAAGDVAEMLAIATSVALHSALPGPGFVSDDNVRLLSAGPA